MEDQSKLVLEIPKLDLTEAKEIQDFNARRKKHENRSSNIDMKIFEKIERYLKKNYFNFNKKYKKNSNIFI